MKRSLHKCSLALRHTGYNQWRWWRGKRCKPSHPGMIKLKTGPPLNLYAGINIPLVFSGLLFLFRFSNVFTSIFQWFYIGIRYHNHYSYMFSECWLAGLLQSLVGSIQLSLIPWLESILAPLVTLHYNGFFKLWKHCYRFTHAFFHKI